LEENKTIIEQLQDNQFVSAVELNLSCPNVPNKPQTGYDFEQVRRVLDTIFEFNAIPLGVKLPPYFDFVHFQEVADILNKYPLAFVTCINSIGNGLVIDAESETVVIKPKGGFGGLGGDIVKPTALANVRMFRQLLNTDIQLVGCGGVRTGKDVFEHILCGADVVQVGTQLMQEGVSVFARLNAELQEVMQQKGYTSIADFKGKLKTL
jgi:dihydroorotate dehydrogenase (fumarate)